jgi:hypothetical protein
MLIGSGPPGIARGFLIEPGINSEDLVASRLQR